uniref:Uncharacterized protein n=1 Tax=Ixodes ricinus TaxID=34613 RepID=A0A6B0UJ73_IXORI
MELSCTLGIDSRVDAMLVLGQSGLRVGSRDYSLQTRDKAEHGTCRKHKATGNIHCTINFRPNFQEDIRDKSSRTVHCWNNPEDKPLRANPPFGLEGVAIFLFLYFSVSL